MNGRRGNGPGSTAAVETAAEEPTWINEHIAL
jgi:hypothetical protein